MMAILKKHTFKPKDNLRSRLINVLQCCWDYNLCIPFTASDTKQFAVFIEEQNGFTLCIMHLILNPLSHKSVLNGCLNRQIVHFMWFLPDVKTVQHN